MSAPSDNPVARILAVPARGLAILGGWWLLALSFRTVFEILARKLFGFSLQGVDEIGAYTLAVFSALAFAWALMTKAHTRVDFLIGHLPGLARARLNTLAYLLLAAFAIYAAWRGWHVLEESLEFQAHANSPLQTPLWIPQSAWLAGLVAFAIAAGTLAAHALLMLVTGPTARVNALYGPMTLAEEVEAEAGAVLARTGAGETTPVAAPAAAAAAAR